MRMPSVTFQALGTLQSENVQLDFPAQVPLPAIELPLYRVQAYGEASYVLYDGGRLDATRALSEARIARQQGEVRVSSDAIRRQVQDLWFQALGLQQQQALIRSGLEVLQARIEAVKTAVAQGVVLESTLLELEAQRMQSESELERLQHRRAGLLATLAVLTGLPVDTATVLVWPAEPEIPQADFHQRADMQVWPLRQAELSARAQQLDPLQKPTVAAFAQAGLGTPNPLNFFDDNFSPYGLIGLRASWKPFDWGASRHQRDALSVQALMLDQQRQQALQALEAQRAALIHQIEGWEVAIQRDRAILELRQRIAEEAALQLEQGVLTAADYLLRWQAAQTAALNLALHRLYRLQTLYQLQALHGRF